MKQERHVICSACYTEMIGVEHQGKPAPGHPVEPCCRCGKDTDAAIYLMAKPPFLCRVDHDEGSPAQ